MIKIDNTEVYGWGAAIRGMRNPMNSWAKSDTVYCGDYNPEIGDNDLGLMERLVFAGEDHSKFMRMINVTCDIIAPLYWWKEYDTYKVGTVANSCSTMHKIHAKEFTVDDFSFERTVPICSWFITSVLNVLNAARERFLETKDKMHWDTMIQFLPSSYNQKRTVQLNYAVLRNMYHSRKNHKLDEWRDFCKWVESLPYAEALICGRKETDNFEEWRKEQTMKETELKPEYAEIQELYDYCIKIGVNAELETMFDGYAIRFGKNGDFIQHYGSYGCNAGCVEPAIGCRLDYTAVPLKNAKALVRYHKERLNRSADNEQREAD